MSKNKSIYNNKLQAAKRRIFDSLKKEGINIVGVRHRLLISEFFNRNDIQRPIELRWQDFVIKLYEQGQLGGITPATKKVKASDDYRQKYIDYLNSDEWKYFRKKALNHFDNQCGLCTSTIALQLHHKTYKNLFNETFADVIPLCRKCHKLHHKK